MAAISITQRAGKGYTVVFSDDTYYFSQLYYRAAVGQGLTLYNETLLRTGMRGILYTEVTINSVTGFASMSAVCDALDAIGINAYNPVLTDGSQQTKIVDESGNFLYPSGQPYVESAEITRLANTTAYAANDAVNSVVAVAQVETVTISGTSGIVTITGAGGLTKGLPLIEGTAQVETVTLTGTSGTATMAAAGGLSKTVTFASDLTTTAGNFVTDFAADYLAVGILLSSSAEDIIFTANDPGTAFTAPTITNATGDLAGTVDHTVANVTDIDASVIAFHTANEADYATEGITLTYSGADLIFTASVAGVPFTSPVATNSSGDLAGAVVNTTANVTPETLEFEQMAIANGGGGVLGQIKVESNITAMASKNLRLWIYNDAPTYVQNDNAAHAIYYADRAKLIGYVDVTMDALNGSSDTVVGQTTPMYETYKCADTSLFIAVQTLSAFTPTSGGKINITLNVIKLS